MDINLVSGPKAHREFISHRLSETEARALESTGLDFSSVYAAGVFLLGPDESIRTLATLAEWWRSLDRAPKGASKDERKDWRASLVRRSEVRDLMDRIWGITRSKHAIENGADEGTGDGLPKFWDKRLCGKSRKAMLQHRFMMDAEFRKPSYKGLPASVKEEIKAEAQEEKTS